MPVAKLLASAKADLIGKCNSVSINPRAAVVVRYGLQGLSLAHTASVGEHRLLACCCRQPAGKIF